MATSAYRLPSPYDEVPLRRRASGLGLALALNLLVLLILLGLSSQVRFEPVSKGGPTIISIAAEKAAEERAEPEAARPPPATPKTHPPLIAPPIVLPPPTPPQPPTDSPLVELSEAELRSIDTTLATRSPGARSAGDSAVVGSGPNGETLYAAEWQRKPTNQELSYYLPPNSQDGFGIIACKTVPDNRVDDCVAIESRPASSRLAGAALRAAWQFRVRPPRKNGKPMIGEWVRIRIEYVISGGR